MNYEKLIQTVSEIVENPNIEKDGLILTYELEDKQHKEINEALYYKMNPIVLAFVPTDIFEVEVGGILVKFIKKI